VAVKWGELAVGWPVKTEYSAAVCSVADCFTDQAVVSSGGFIAYVLL
jgi:hypothetical protein